MRLYVLSSVVILLTAFHSDASCIRDVVSAFSSTPHGRSSYAQLLKAHRQRGESLITLEKEMIARYHQGEPHARILVDRLGVKIRGDHLIFPKDPLQVFENVNRAIDDLIAKGLIKPGEEIRPALTFVRKGQQKTEYQFVVPGRDPLPSSEWKLHELNREHVFTADGQKVAKTGDMSMGAWSLAMAEGKMPTYIGMFDHDLSHLTDFIQNPKIMGMTRKAYRDQVKNFDPKTEPDFIPMRGTRFDVRLAINAENYAHPAITKPENIKTVLSYWGPDAGKKVVTLSENKVRFERSVNEFNDYVDSLIRNREQLLERHGGGMRDSYNAQRAVIGIPGQLNASNLFQERVLAPIMKVKHKPWRNELNHGTLRESLYALLEEIRILKLMKENMSQRLPPSFQLPGGFEDSAILAGHMSRKKKAPTLSMVDDLLRERVNQFQVAYQNAAALNLSADRVFHDSFMIGSTEYISSPTRRYFQSFLSPERDPIHYRAFVEWKELWAD